MRRSSWGVIHHLTCHRWALLLALVTVIRGHR